MGVVNYYMERQLGIHRFEPSRCTAMVFKTTGDFFDGKAQGAGSGSRR
jgi:hypothetical protein